MQIIFTLSISFWITSDYMTMRADRPHLTHLLNTTQLLSLEPKLFVAPVWAEPAAPKAGSAAAATKALNAKTPRKARAVPTPISLATVMVHDLLFAKRGLTLPKEHKVRKKLEKYLPKYVVLLYVLCRD